MLVDLRRFVLGPNMRTLLTVPDLIAAIQPIVGNRVVVSDMFRLIGAHVIEPFGFVQRMPVFQLDQVGEVAEKVKAAQDDSKRTTRKECVACAS